MSRQVAPATCFRPFEAEARAVGYRYVVGIDEAGRGPLAGPVVAASVLLPAHASIQGLRDSKRLTVRQREQVYERIRDVAITYGVGVVAADQIDRHHILWATKDAMRQAVEQLTQKPDMLLIDGTATLPVRIAQWPIVHGDAVCASIAAASVIAKVTRDRLMIDYAKQYPAYGFERHKGYPTQEHYTHLQRLGPCPIHRHSFRGVTVTTEQRG